MNPSRVTPDQIASAAGLTEKHVRRIIHRAEGAGPFVSPMWYGRRIDVIRDTDGPKVVFSTLPDHIREAFVMLDQQELSLPPPRVQIKLH